MAISKVVTLKKNKYLTFDVKRERKAKGKVRDNGCWMSWAILKAI